MDFSVSRYAMKSITSQVQFLWSRFSGRGNCMIGDRDIHNVLNLRTSNLDIELFFHKHSE